MGKKKVPILLLKKALQNTDFLNVKTLLHSGNVIFERDQQTKEVSAIVEKVLATNFPFLIDTIIRPFNEITALIQSNPFKEIVVTPQLRLSITFLAEKPSKELKEKKNFPKGDFEILTVTDHEVASAFTLSKSMGTTKLMEILEKYYGKRVTTRNWNTVVKIGSL